MANLSVVNYDENGSFSKKFHDEGEDLAQLYSHTRQRVHALHKEWAGDAAEAFFEEMEVELLPALLRVSNALFLSAEVLNKVVKIIREADEETARYFKEDLGADFGAGLFAEAGALGGTGGGGSGAGGDDFGASQFEEALPGQAPGGEAGNSGGGVSIPTAPEISKAWLEERVGDPEAPETPPAEPAESSSGGGGGGGSGGEGKGDLKGLGTGIGGQPQQVSSGGAGGSQAMPDHIFEGGAGGGGESQPGGSSGGGSGAPQEQSAGGIGTAAGVVGGIAAAGGVGKAIKDGLDKSDQ